MGREGGGRNEGGGRCGGGGGCKEDSVQEDSAGEDSYATGGGKVWRGGGVVEIVGMSMVRVVVEVVVVSLLLGLNWTTVADLTLTLPPTKKKCSGECATDAGERQELLRWGGAGNAQRSTTRAGSRAGCGGATRARFGTTVAVAVTGETTNPLGVQSARDNVNVGSARGWGRGRVRGHGRVILLGKVF